jgi:hypothetical protein
MPDDRIPQSPVCPSIVDILFAEKKPIKIARKLAKVE